MHRRHAALFIAAAAASPCRATTRGSRARSPARDTVSSVGCGDIEGVEDDTIVVEGQPRPWSPPTRLLAGDGADANFAGLLEAVEVDLGITGVERRRAATESRGRREQHEGGKKGADKMWAAAVKPILHGRRG